MRRFLFALLVLPLTTIAPSPPVGADGTIHPPTMRIVATTDRAVVRSVATKHRVPSAAQVTRHVLAVNAHSLKVTVDQLRAEWQHVAVCEVGGNWSMTGSAYSGIGFLNSTWSAYGGTQYAPNAGLATRDQQIIIGMKVTNGWVPDQYGCAHGGW